MKFLDSLLSTAAVISGSIACDGCYGQQNDVVLTRHVRRMQPEAANATSGPRSPLEWGQLNVLHTTDTHGWLEGHLKEQNYGADWGDYVSFVKHMRRKARDLDVDLLLVDTGDLHDGNGLSDATSPNGLVSNQIFENIDYDLLTIGNHELYVSAIAYEHFNQFAKVYGDRYLTSNVQILNPATNQFEYIGKQYRYFTTEHGLRIMAFGVLFDFTGNSNASKVIKAKDMVQQPWFKKAVYYDDPVDLFIVLGHNPVRANDSSSTFKTIYRAIRESRPDTPVQIFGGHSHIRDFQVYDNKATALESGRYCETLGWWSATSFDAPHYQACEYPEGVPRPSREAVVVSPNATALNLSLSNSPTSLRYSRRYLDWNRLTFAYHANGSQDSTFDSKHGKAVTAEITVDRKKLNISSLYGCAPQTWCLFCKPFGDPGNLNTLLETALSATVINASRADKARLIFINSGSARFDLVEGPFTYDDSFIVSPFSDSFLFLPDIPYAAASQLLALLNAGPVSKKRDTLSYRSFDFSAGLEPLFGDPDICRDPPISHDHLAARSYPDGRLRRHQQPVTPGYVTYDDFGSDGDDTVHSPIPSYPQPKYIQANASFPTNRVPAAVDVVFLDFIEPNVIAALTKAGAPRSTADVAYYLPQSFTTNSYLPAYAKLAWQANVPNCPVGNGVGFNRKR